MSLGNCLLKLCIYSSLKHSSHAHSVLATVPVTGPMWTGWRETLAGCLGGNDQGQVGRAGLEFRSVSVGWQISVILTELAVEAIRTDEFSQVYR